MYPSQVRWLVCYPGSPPVPRYSGAVPGTVCPGWLCEHRGEKNWVAGAIQFPLAGWPLQGHNWSEGKVFRGTKSLLCHSSSGEIPTVRADTRSPERHISLSNITPWRGRGQAKAKCNSSASSFPRCWGGRHADTDVANPISVCSISIQTSASQSKREHCIIALLSGGRWEQSVLCCCWFGVSFGESGKMLISLWLRKVQAPWPLENLCCLLQKLVLFWRVFFPSVLVLFCVRVKKVTFQSLYSEFFIFFVWTQGRYFFTCVQQFITLCHNSS